MKLAQVEVPDCVYGPYQHWWEVGAYQFGLVVGGLLTIICVMLAIVSAIVSRMDS